MFVTGIRKTPEYIRRGLRPDSQRGSVQQFHQNNLELHLLNSSLLVPLIEFEEKNYRIIIGLSTESGNLILYSWNPTGFLSFENEIHFKVLTHRFLRSLTPGSRNPYIAPVLEIISAGRCWDIHNHQAGDILQQETHEPLVNAPDMGGMRPSTVWQSL